MKSFVVIPDAWSNEWRHHICVCCGFPTEPITQTKCEETMPHFKSYEEAKDNGWARTDHRHICPPSKLIGWVCPDCWKEFRNGNN